MSPLVYRGSDCPVMVGGGFMIRSQSVEVNRMLNFDPVYELGHKGPTGILKRGYEYSATVTAFEVGQGVAAAFGCSGSLKAYYEQEEISGVIVACPMLSVSGGVVTAIEATATVDGGATVSVTVMGTGVGAGGGDAGELDDESPGASGPGGCSCSTGSFVQRATIRSRANFVKGYALGSDEPIGNFIDSVDVTAEVEVIHPGTCSWFSDEEPGSVTVVIGGVSYSLPDAVSVGEPATGTVRGWATHKYIYRSKSGDMSIGS